MIFENFLKLNTSIKHHAILFVSKQFELHHFPNDAFCELADKICNIVIPRLVPDRLDPADKPRDDTQPRDDNVGFYHPDILIIDRDRNQLRLEDVEKIKDFCLYPPQLGSRRLIFIENCERLNLNSANFILKSLEEPAANVCFLFTTAHRHLILPTIISRLQTIYITFPALHKKSFMDDIEPKDLQFIKKIIYSLSPQNVFFGQSLSDKKNFCAKPEFLSELITNCEQLSKKYPGEHLRSLIIYYVAERLKTDKTFVIMARFMKAHIQAWKRAEQFNVSSQLWLLRIFLGNGTYENK